MNNLLNRSKAFVTRNSSTILTCVGGVGVVATAVMAVKATPKALSLLETARVDKGDELTPFETVRIAGPVYIPSVIVGAATIACIFGANTLNKRQQATLMSAYALLDSSYKDYKNKVAELYGEEAHAKVTGEIAKDKYDETSMTRTIGKQLFYDEFSGRYFESTMENVINAQYAINRKIALQSGAYLNEWYEALDIPPTEYGYGLGWSSGLLMDYQWSGWLEFIHNKVLIDDDLECIIIAMSVEPIFDFEYY